MSVEQQVTQLGVSVNSLVDSARTIIEQGGAPAGGEPLPGAGAGVISVAQTLTVGPGQDFADIQSAWDSLKGLVINAPVAIQVIDGTHDIQPITLDAQPFAHNIRILGNLAAPESCVLQLQAAADGTLHGPNFEGVRGLEFAGFKIASADPAALWGLRVAESANVFSLPNSIVIEGCEYGARVVRGAFYAAEGLRTTDCLNGIYSNDARADTEKADITGRGTTETGYGVYADNNGTVIADESAITTFRIGCAARLGGATSCHGTQVQNAYTGVLATNGGFVDAGATEAGTKTMALNCERQGFYAALGSFMVAHDAIADNAYEGFLAAYQSLLYCVRSTAKNNSLRGYRAFNVATVLAWQSQANASGNASNYSASSGSVHNHGAVIHHD